jgi:hypothetical protein
MSNSRFRPPHVPKFVFSALFLRRHRAACNYLKTQCSLDSGWIRRESRTYRILMDAILFLETIVHFHSYARYKVLHTGRVCAALAAMRSTRCLLKARIYIEYSILKLSASFVKRHGWTSPLSPVQDSGLKLCVSESCFGERG